MNWWDFIQGFAVGLLPGLLWATINVRARTKEIDVINKQYDNMKRHYLEFLAKNEERSRLNE